MEKRATRVSRPTNLLQPRGYAAMRPQCENFEIDTPHTYLLIKCGSTYDISVNKVHTKFQIKTPKTIVSLVSLESFFSKTNSLKRFKFWHLKKCSFSEKNEWRFK